MEPYLLFVGEGKQFYGEYRQLYKAQSICRDFRNVKIVAWREGTLYERFSLCGEWHETSIPAEKKASEKG